MRIDGRKASAVVPRVAGVSSEKQHAEVERVLLHISDAAVRARRAVEVLEKDGADPHVVAALRTAEDDLERLRLSLSQGTLFAVPEETLKLAV